MFPNNHHKSGFVVILGMSSAGKSTFLNSILRQKIAITTSKRQSTRMPMRGIFTDQRGQIVFIDTPGYFKPKDKLEEYMLNSMKNSIKSADIILFIADINAPANLIPKEFTELALRAQCPKILALSKIDRKNEFKISDNIDLLNLSTYFDQTIPISAVNKINIEKLTDALFSILPEGPLLYPEDELTDSNSQFIISEIVRESIFDIIHEEVPYSVAVYCEPPEERESGKFYIDCVIYVERDSQKGIIIGKSGLTIKKIGMRSREVVEKALEIKCFLELRVKVAEKWRKDDRYLKMFGYSVKSEN